MISCYKGYDETLPDLLSYRLVARNELLESHLQREDQITDRDSMPDGNLNTVSDAELIQRTLNGDDSAFRAIVEKYQNQVAATIIGMLGYGPESDDIGQETFIRLYRSLKDIRGGSSLGTYLTRIAINLCLDSVRRNQRKRNWFRLDHEVEAIPEELIIEDNNKIENSEKREWIEMALNSLDSKHRAVIVLRLMGGYSTKETASLLKIPLGTVLSRLSRAEEKLKQFLKPLMEY
jgi:RNA polymerase sigma-70 factor, ECF subfamily